MTSEVYYRANFDDEDEFDDDSNDNDSADDEEDDDERGVAHNEPGSYHRVVAESEIKLYFDEDNVQSQDSLGALTLENRKSEILHVVSKVREKRDLERVQRLLTLEDVVDVIFGNEGSQNHTPWMKCLKTRIKNVLNVPEHAQSDYLMPGEIDSFVEATLLVHIYQVSPDDLWDPLNYEYFKSPIMSKKRYKFILNRLSMDIDRPNHVEGIWNPRDIVTCQPLLTKCWSLLGDVFQEIAYLQGVTIISLDDEKEHMRSVEVNRVGLHRGFQRGGNPGPTIFMGVNKSLGLLLAAQLQRLGESTQDCAKKTLAKSVGFDGTHEMVNLNRVSLSADRGINSHNLLAEVVSLGAKLTGTVPHNKITKIQAFHSYPSQSAVNSALSVNRPSSSGSAIASHISQESHYFSDQGYKAAYWVKQTFNNGRFAYLLALRQGHGKSVYLISSDPALGPGNYVLERSGTHSSFIGFIYDLKGVEIDSLHKDEMECRQYFTDRLQVRFVTQRQADAIWFLLRMFSFTSAVSRKVLLAIRKSCREYDDQMDLFVSMFNLGEEVPLYEERLTFDDYSKMNLKTLKSHCGPNKALQIKGFSIMNKGVLTEAVKAELEKDSIPLNSTETISKAFFSAWFLQPSKTTPAMAEGSANEINVVKATSHFLADKTESIRIREIITTGLVKHPTVNYIATSPDALVTLITKTKKSSWHRSHAIVEIKTHTSEKVINSCRNLASQFGDVSITVASSQSEPDRESFTKFKDKIFEFDTIADFNEAIPNADHRAQLVHHSATLQTPIVLYIDATTTEIIRIVILFVCEDVSFQYVELLNRLADRYLSWIYDNNEPVPIFSDKVLGFCTDQHTLLQTLSLWFAVTNLYTKRGSVPFPPIKKINPALVTYWNHTKGGVDIGTREKVDNTAHHQHLAVVSRLYDLLLLEALVNLCKLYKWVRVGERNLGSIQSTDELKNIYHKISIKSVLKELSVIFRNRALKSQDDSVVGNHPSTSTRPTTMGFTFTAENFLSPASVVCRTTGNHIFSYDEKQSKKCIVCRAATRFYCGKCGFRACVQHHKNCSSFPGELLTCYERVHSADTQTLRRPIQNKKAVAEDVSDEDADDASDEDDMSTRNVFHSRNTTMKVKTTQSRGDGKASKIQRTSSKDNR